MLTISSDRIYHKHLLQKNELNDFLYKKDSHKMAKKKSTEKRKVGRQEIPIDWDFVDGYLEAKCSGREIAGLLGINQDTLYDRCLKDKGEIFTDYSAKLRAKGESCLRKVQYDCALAGDKTMLVWLGKNRLEQTDKSEIKTVTVEPQVQRLLAVWEAMGKSPEQPQ